MSRRSVRECAGLVEGEMSTEVLGSRGRNRFYLEGSSRGQMVFVSQSKPSEHSTGHWKYHFFHTIGASTVEEILEGGGNLILLDYVNSRYVRLNTGDIVWALLNSSRIKGKRNESVVDFVVREVKSETGGALFLVSYHKDNDSRRHVKLTNFQFASDR